MEHSTVPFFILFILIPLSELFVFLRVSDQIGLGTALFMALCTAIIGGMLVRHQGIQTLIKAQNSMKQGGLPSKELFDGLCIVAAGATLITPGFITDVIGFALLVPKVRDLLREHLSKNAKFSVGGFNTEHKEFHGHSKHHNPRDPDIIDVEFETIDKKDKE